LLVAGLCCGRTASNPADSIDSGGGSGGVPTGGSGGTPSSDCEMASDAGSAGVSTTLQFDCVNGGPQCASGSYCWMDDHGCGYCAAYAQEGHSCISDGCAQNALWNVPCCAPGLRCLTSTTGLTCQMPEPVGLGAACGSGNLICAASLFCNEAGICEASSSRDVGERCGTERDSQPSSGSCRSGLFCAELGTCALPRGAGQACATSNQCQSDLFCDYAGTSQCTIPGTITITNSCCEPKVANGASCWRGNEQCQSGLCVPQQDRSLCSASPWVPAALGQWCPDPRYGPEYGLLSVCQPGLFCSNNTCQKRFNEGEPCANLPRAACADGTFCDLNTGLCAKPHCVGAGDFCDDGFPCPAGLVCSGRCVQPLGGSCSTSDGCELAATCSGGACAPRCPW
jgi:hypothetical protein